MINNIIIDKILSLTLTRITITETQFTTVITNTHKQPSRSTQHVQFYNIITLEFIMNDANNAGSVGQVRTSQCISLIENTHK